MHPDRWASCSANASATSFPSAISTWNCPEWTEAASRSNAIASPSIPRSPRGSATPSRGGCGSHGASVLQQATMDDILQGRYCKTVPDLRLDDYGVFFPCRTRRFEEVRTHSFDHTPGFYRYRLALVRTVRLPGPMADYLHALFTDCPNHLFRDTVLRASRVRRSGLGIEIPLTRLKEHDIIALAAESHDHDTVSSRHENLQKFFLECDPTTIACEVPVWMESWEFEDYPRVLGQPRRPDRPHRRPSPRGRRPDRRLGLQAAGRRRARRPHPGLSLRPDAGPADRPAPDRFPLRLLRREGRLHLPADRSPPDPRNHERRSISRQCTTSVRCSFAMTCSCRADSQDMPSTRGQPIHHAEPCSFVTVCFKTNGSNRP